MDNWEKLAYALKDINEAQGVVLDLQSDEIKRLRAKVDALQNEVNAVEWVNGRMEKELSEAYR